MDILNGYDFTWMPRKKKKNRVSETGSADHRVFFPTAGSTPSIFLPSDNRIFRHGKLPSCKYRDLTWPFSTVVTGRYMG